MSLSQPQACPGYAFTGSRSRGGRWAASASERGREPGLGPAERERGRCREPPSCPRYGAWRGAWPEVGGACDGRAQKWAGPWRRRPLPGYGERGAGGAGQRTACAGRGPGPSAAPRTLHPAGPRAPLRPDLSRDLEGWTRSAAGGAPSGDREGECPAPPRVCGAGRRWFVALTPRGFPRNGVPNGGGGGRRLPKGGRGQARAAPVHRRAD